MSDPNTLLQSTPAEPAQKQEVKTEPAAVVDGAGSAKSPFPGYVTGMLKKEQAEALSKELANDPTIAERLPKGIPELFDSWRTLHAQASTAVRVPGKDASEAEKAAYRKAIGVPEKPEDYAFEKPTLPEGMTYSAEFENWLKKTAFETGIPLEAAKRIYSGFMQQNLSNVKAQTEAAARAKADRAQAEAVEVTNAAAALRTEFGAKYDEVIQGASAQLLKLPKNQQDAIQVSGLGRSPDFIKMLYWYSRATRSDSLLGLGTEAGEREQTPGINYGDGFAKRYKVS